MQVHTIRALLRMLPLRVGTTGRARDLLLHAGDQVVPASQRTGAVDVALAGHPLILDLAHDNERLVAYCGAAVLASLRRTPLGRYLRPGPQTPGALFVDIGANLGLYALLARAAGFATWLFEPEPRHAAYLARNTRALGRVFPIALADTPGQADLFVAQADNAGASSLVGQGTDYVGTVAVPVARFDAIAARELDGRPVGLVKIDVEGAEEEVVRGMAGFLEVQRPPIWCEVRGPRSARRPDTHVAVVGLLERFGYRAWEPLPRAGFRPFAPRADQRVFDLLFTPPLVG